MRGCGDGIPNDALKTRRTRNQPPPSLPHLPKNSRALSVIGSCVSGATFTAALRHKDAAYAVALAESLLRDTPLVGQAAVQAYDRAKAYAPDDDEGKMIEIVSRAKGI